MFLDSVSVILKRYPVSFPLEFKHSRPIYCNCLVSFLPLVDLLLSFIMTIIMYSRRFRNLHSRNHQLLVYPQNFACASNVYAINACAGFSRRPS